MTAPLQQIVRNFVDDHGWTSDFALDLVVAWLVKLGLGGALMQLLQQEADEREDAR